MTPNNKYIKMFEEKFRNVYATVFQLSGYDKKQLKEKKEIIEQFILSCLEQKDKEWREKIEDMDWLEFRAKHKDTDQRTFLLTISEVLKRV